MTQKMTKEVEYKADSKKRDWEDIEYRNQKIKQYMSGMNRDTTLLDNLVANKDRDYKYSFVSIIDENNNHNIVGLTFLKTVGYEVCPPEEFPELEYNINPQFTLKEPCATYNGNYILKIPKFVDDARGRIEFQKNKERAEAAKKGYGLHMELGDTVKNDLSKTNLEVQYGPLNSFMAPNNLSR